MAISSDPQLRRWFLDYNRRYFSGTLPDDTPVYWEPPNGSLGDCTVVEEHEGEPLVEGKYEFVIRIDPAIRWSSVLSKFTLLHEMCHQKLYPYMGHGKKFQDEMKRLAMADAFRYLW